jgi:cation transport protein ChaC
MNQTPDPFVHHPELREKIACSETSFFRNFNIDDLVKLHPQLEEFRPWTHSDAEREAIRAKALEHHTGDLWIFAYGSLMWDPALRFQEVRRVFAPGHARRFILKEDQGGRGTKEAPGLMAALDEGDGCEGLAYRIAEKDVEAETEILFRRELVGPGYRPTFIQARSSQQDMQVFSFLADHTTDEMVPGIARSDQVRWIATGTGFLGSSYDYLAKIVAQLAHLGIDDAACTALLRDVDAYRSSYPAKEAAK